jgi:hypothetical protein
MQRISFKRKASSWLRSNNTDHTHPGASAVAAIVIRTTHVAVEGTIVGATWEVKFLIHIASIAIIINPPDCVPSAHRWCGARRRGITDGGTTGRPGTKSRPLHRRGRSLVNEEI